MSWTFCTTGAAVHKAGHGADPNITSSGAVLQNWSDQVEASINTLTRKDWNADYSSIGANFTGVLEDLASDLMAMKIISYNLSGYTSRSEAQTILDVLRDNIMRNLEVLKEEKHKEKM